ncbi:MAG: ribosome maturation factor RimP [Acidimicrobiia bacterium]|nr:ribosome maturation factor RimP [Acidimicrobiia bacterium]
MADLGVTERVHELVEPLLAAHDVEVVDVEQVGATLRVTVDRAGGIDLDAVSEATLVVSDALDRNDPIPGRYTLEVSSPGLERPLRTPAHFQRFVGADIAVKTKPDVAGDRRLEGRLESADDDGFVVGGRRLAYGDVDRARTVFVWEPAERGKAKARSGKRRASTGAKRRSAAPEGERRTATSTPEGGA